MTTITLAPVAPGRTPISAWMTPWQAWGVILIVPYVLVFIFFVLYPIGYGLWLARHPASYVKLFDDPVFARTIVNNENVWAKAMNRVVNDKIPVDQAVTEMIARIKAIAG